MSAVPKLRFGEFDGDWRSSRVSELSKSFSGGTPVSTRTSNYGGNIPFIRSGEIGKTSTAQFLSQSGFDSSSAKMVEKGDLLIAMYGANSGDAAIAQLSGAINQAILCIKYDGPSKFLFEQYSRSQSVIVHKFLQGGQGNLSGKIISEIEFRFPPIIEQKKIADFLGAVDEKIAGLRERESLLTQYKKGVMQKIFSQEIRFKQEARSANGATGKHNDDDGRDFPDWGQAELGEIFDEVQDKVGNRDIETYSISSKTGFKSQKEKFGKDISGEQNERYVVLQPNQFSYNKGNSKTFKYGCVYLSRFDFAIAVPNVFISFKLRDSENITEFYSQLFMNHHLDWGLRRIISSSARMNGLLNLSKSAFFKLEVPAPHPDEQQKIADFLSAIDDKITAVSAQITQMQDFKKGLLQQMFV